MQTNLNLPATGFQPVAADMSAPKTATGQHRYLPSARPAPTPPVSLSKAQLVAQLKRTITEMVYCNEPISENNSLYISQKLKHDYAYLARIFSDATGSTIERTLIAKKIERVKELLHADNLNISEIANLLNYSNVGHLCNQFKKITGVTPGFFKQLMRQRDISSGYLSSPAQNDVTIFCNCVITNFVRPANFAR